MIWESDSCKAIEGLIHLSIDGKLDGLGRRRLEKHLAACVRCTEKLERLRTIEAGTRSIGLEEPPPEYWSTFSRRVIEKIETGPGGRPVWNPTRAFAGLFAEPRMRIAAAVASLAIVVLVGALYLHNRGRIVPSVPAREEIGKVSQAARTVEPEAGRAVESKAEAKAQTRSEPAVEPRAEIVAKLRSESASVVSSERARAVAAESVAANLIQPSVVTVAELHRIDTLMSAKSPVVAERSKEGAAIVDTATRAAEVQPAVKMADAFSEKKGERAAMQFSKSEAASTVRGESFMLDGAMVRRVSAADTSMSEGALRGVIHEWRAHIEQSPLDPRNSQGCLQVANAYYLLARLTRDEAVISEGARLVQEYADGVGDPGLKAQLLDSKARIESLRGK